VAICPYYRYISGRTYAAFQRLTSSQINYPPSLTGRTPYIEPAGSRRIEGTNALDLRLEKIFKVGSGGDRVAVHADITNLWNASTILTVNRRYPSLGIAGFDDPMEFRSPHRDHRPAAVDDRSALELLVSPGPGV